MARDDMRQSTTSSAKIVPSAFVVRSSGRSPLVKLRTLSGCTEDEVLIESFERMPKSSLTQACIKSVERTEFDVIFGQNLRNSTIAQNLQLSQPLDAVHRIKIDVFRRMTGKLRDTARQITQQPR